MPYFYIPSNKDVHDIALSKTTKQSKLVEWFMKFDAIHDENVCVYRYVLYHIHTDIYTRLTHDNVYFPGVG